MYLFGATAGGDFINGIRDFFEQVFVEFAELWFWPIIVFGIMIFAIIFVSILVGCSYENRILKSVNKLNAYFLDKPFITEENLVEFNLKMKRVPKVLRNNWQIYMLNREDSPTTYINVNTCIDKPLRTSSIEKNIGNFSLFTLLLCVASFFVGLQYVRGSMSGRTNLGEIIFFSALVPLGLLTIYTIFTLIIKAVKNDIYSMLYDNFPLYERNLTKAVSTLPAYVDYEILFTSKEIREGIPILQQYLEKRALIEQQELEKARANSVACEEYDFSELGIDGSLVLERAMKECETFIRTRNRLQEECGQIETEKDNYKKTYEANEKDYQRKLQASRENLESLKTQQENSTNRIESNYIRKQQSDEIKKQQQLEKDNEEAAAKFAEEQTSLQQEIDKRQQEIEEKKAFVQQAMALEFKHYANTLYKALTQKATEIGNQKLFSLSQENLDLKALLTDIQGIEQPNYNDQSGLIQNEEITTENLYEMTQSDVNELNESREVSEAMSQEEAQKQQEQEANKKAQDENNDGNDSDDAGQKMTENIVEEPAKQEEDLDAIQKQIEEENNKLQEQKQAFQNDLNTTISQMDNNTATQNQEVAQPEVVEQQEVAPQPEVQQQVETQQPVQQQVAQEQTPVAQEQAPITQEHLAEGQPESEPMQNEEPDKKEKAAPKPRATSRRGARSTSRASTSRASSNSAIDALNDEMNKLLDSTKNS